MTEYFHTKNTRVLKDPVTNPCFEELLDMTDLEFEEWTRTMRSNILAAWDESGMPPRSGKSKADIIKSFNRLTNFPVWKFTQTDELTGIENDTILNNIQAAYEVDQFFPTMMKARIHYDDKSNGYSVYDMFADDKHLPSMVKGCNRHFRRDSFYYYSKTLKIVDPLCDAFNASSGIEWVRGFVNNRNILPNHDFWIQEIESKEGQSTSYIPVEQKDFAFLAADDMRSLLKENLLSERNLCNISPDDIKDSCVYMLRVFKKKQRIFPGGFKAFRVGYIQVAVNFRPMTAKYLYERFTNHIKDDYAKEDKSIHIYDPSSGWGGRILGAMSVKDDRRIHYIGTDPNPENYIEEIGMSRYEYLAKFFNDNTIRSNPFFSHANTFDVYQEGSEEIGKHPDFQKYKGKLDLVFTSPPYFNREGYAEDEKQSYKQFPKYDSWVEGFLKPTLTTCVEYLRPNRYLLWNIADILIKKDQYYPLEQDSRDILESLGMKYIMTMRMAMAPMPGQNRTDEDGLPKCKNYCKVNGQYLKYEPIFVYYKET